MSDNAKPAAADESAQAAPPEDASVSAGEPTQTSPAPVPEAAAPTTEEEALPPSTVHPSAASGFTEAHVKENADKGPFFIGMWHDKANYGCPFCYFSTIEGSGAVELHILEKQNAGDIKHRDYVAE